MRKINVIVAVLVGGYVCVEEDVHRFTWLPCPRDQVVSALLRVSVADSLTGGPGRFADGQCKAKGAVHDDLEVKGELVRINGLFPDGQRRSLPGRRYLAGAK